MLIEFTIKADTGNEKTEELSIHVDKFFHFMVIGEKERGNKRYVDVYTAICFRSRERENTRLHVSLNATGDKGKNSEKSDVSTEDVSHFYQQDEILKQFWGKGCYKNSNRTDFIHKLKSKNVISGVDNAITDIYSSDETRYSPLLVSDKGKENLKDFILIPKEIEKDESKKDNVILNSYQPNRTSKLDDIVSNGFWFKHSFLIDFNINDGSFYLDHHIIFDSCIKSEDFKVYYQLPEDNDIKNNSIEIKRPSDEEVSGEVHRVYSQSSINYFKEWADGGIYYSPLIRLNNTSKINEFISGGVSKFQSKINIEDKKQILRKEIKIFSFSIILSALFSIGFDYTRVDTAITSNYFPSFGLGFFSVSFWWFFICLGLLLKFITLEKLRTPKKRRALYLLNLPVLIFLWTFFFIEQDLYWGLVKEKGYLGGILSWIVYLPAIDYAISIYISLCLIYSNFDRSIDSTKLRYLKYGIYFGGKDGR